MAGEDDKEPIFVCRVEKGACGFCPGIAPPCTSVPGGYCTIRSFHRTPHGAENPLLAQCGGAVGLGDAILGVNGVSTAGLGLAQLVALMRDTPVGPTTLQFRRHPEGAPLPEQEHPPPGHGFGALLGRATSAFDGAIDRIADGVGIGAAGDELADEAVARQKCLQEGAVLRDEDPVRWVQAGLPLSLRRVHGGGEGKCDNTEGGDDEPALLAAVLPTLKVFAAQVYAEAAAVDAELARARQGDSDGSVNRSSGFGLLDEQEHERRRLRREYPWLMAAAGARDEEAALQQQNLDGGAWPHAAAVGAQVGSAVFDDD